MQEAYIVLKDVPGWRLQQITAKLREMEGVNSAECLADVWILQFLWSLCLRK